MNNVTNLPKSELQRIHVSKSIRVLRHYFVLQVFHRLSVLDDNRERVIKHVENPEFDVARWVFHEDDDDVTQSHFGTSTISSRKAPLGRVVRHVGQSFSTSILLLSLPFTLAIVVGSIASGKLCPRWETRGPWTLDPMCWCWIVVYLARDVVK
jgi:hypothetical protein